MFDLDHFVLQPHEVLILRLRTHMQREQLAALEAAIAKVLPGRAVLILPPVIEVMGGTIHPVEAAQPVSDDTQVHSAILRAYNDGKPVWAYDAAQDQWYSIHKHANPEAIDFSMTQYALTRPAAQR